MGALLLVLLVGFVVEVFVIIQVGAWIGALPTIGLLILTSAIGTWVLKREGMRAWRDVGAATEQGVMPQRALLDGVLIMVGALLMVFPGFVSDAIGLLLLLPPTRIAIRFLARRSVQRAVDRGRVVRVRSRREPREERQERRHDVVDGEVIRSDEDDDPRH